MYDACAQNEIEVAVEQTIDAAIDYCFINGYNCTDSEDIIG